MTTTAKKELPAGGKFYPVRIRYVFVIGKTIKGAPR